MKAACIDIIVHECVPNFDPSVLQACLSDLYYVFSIVWNACDEGLPIRRERRYTICIRKRLGKPILPFSLSTWSRLVFCNRVATCEIFLNASDEQISKLRDDMCARKGIPSTRIRSSGGVGVWAWEVLMSKAERDVLLTLRKKKLKLTRQNILILTYPSTSGSSMFPNRFSFNPDTVIFNLT